MEKSRLNNLAPQSQCSFMVFASVYFYSHLTTYVTFKIHVRFTGFLQQNKIAVLFVWLFVCSITLVISMMQVLQEELCRYCITLGVKWQLSPAGAQYLLSGASTYAEWKGQCLTPAACNKLKPGIWTVPIGLTAHGYYIRVHTLLTCVCPLIQTHLPIFPQGWVKNRNAKRLFFGFFYPRGIESRLIFQRTPHQMTN